MIFDKLYSLLVGFCSCAIQGVLVDGLSTDWANSVHGEPLPDAFDMKVMPIL
jgi:hypothetical protein